MSYPYVNAQGTGANITKFMKNKHMRVDVLAHKLNISNNAIFKWKRGDSMPTIDNLVILAKIFDTTIDDIVATS